MQHLPPERIESRRRSALLALLLLVPAPSLGIACEMLWFPGTIGLALLAATKLWILVLPLVWTFAVDEQPIERPRRSARGLGLGAATGVAGALVVVLVFQFALRERIDPSAVREMARSNHLLTPAVYLSVAAYTCFVNSLLEEYVWRWFVLGRFEQLCSRRFAVGLSAVAFTLHHSIILGSQFGAAICVIGSIAVFVAGVIWSWLYARTRSIWRRVVEPRADRHRRVLGQDGSSCSWISRPPRRTIVRSRKWPLRLPNRSTPIVRR